MWGLSHHTWVSGEGWGQNVFHFKRSWAPTSQAPRGAHGCTPNPPCPLWVGALRATLQLRSTVRARSEWELVGAGAVLGEVPSQPMCAGS